MMIVPLAKWQRAFYSIATVVIIIGALYLGRVILIPLATAILLAFVLAPPMHGLQRRGLGRWPSALIVVGLAVVACVAIVMGVAGQVKGLGMELPTYKNQIIKKVQSVRDATQSSWLDSVTETAHDISKSVNGNSPSGPVHDEPITVKTDSSMLPTLGRIADSTLGFLVDAGLVLLLVLFMLVQQEDLRNRLIRLIGHDDVTATTKVLDETCARVSRFLLMQLIVNVSYGVVLALGLWLLNVPYPLVWGLLAALLRYIPYLGPVLAALFPIALSFATSETWGPFVLVATFILVLELLTNNILEPLFYGRSIGVSEVALLLAAAFWAWLWGPLGLVLATPMTACLVVLGRHVPQLAIFHLLLGDEPVLDEPTRFFQRLLAHDDEEAADLVEKYLAAHGAESVWNDLFQTALASLTHDRSRGEVSAADEEFMLGAVERMVRDLGLQDFDLSGVEMSQRSSVPTILAVPARDASDVTALGMLQCMLPATKARFTVLSRDVLASEILQHNADVRPHLLVIGTFARKTMSRARLLCKQVRKSFPDAKIIVGCWDAVGCSETNVKRLTDAGADSVAATFTATRDQIQTHLSLANVPGKVTGNKKVKV